eukprot:39781_1
MSSMLFLSVIIFYIIIPSNSEWNCEGARNKCVCEHGKCAMFGHTDYTEYICANTAESCTVDCRDEYSCAKANFHMMAIQNTEIICNGKHSCANSTIYCGKSSLQSCNIRINHKGMSDGLIQCDDNISQCNVHITSNPNQIAMHRTVFECMSPMGCQLNGCNHNQCLQSHMHCMDTSCSCLGNDCNSHVNIHTIHKTSNRQLLQFNTSHASSNDVLHMRSADLSLPDFSVMEYVTIAVSLAFCCGTCAIFIVICYCQRLKYHVIKRYRTSQSVQQHETKALQNHSDESCEHTSNMHSNSNSNCNTTQSDESVSLQIHEEDGDGDTPTTKPHVVLCDSDPFHSNTTTTSTPPVPQPSVVSDGKPDCNTNQTPFITPASYPYNNDTNHLQMLQQSHPAYGGASVSSLPSIQTDQNGIQHHHHYIHYVANGHSYPATVQYNGTNTSQFPSSGPSLPYSPTTTYHERHGSQASQCVTSLINGHHPTQTLQIPNKLRFPKSSSHMSASTLTSITSTRCDATPACLAPTSMSSDISSVDSSNGSVYVCRFEESATFARRSSFRDILGVPSHPTNRTNSKDFAVKGLCDTILSDCQSHTVHAVLPDMVDVEQSLSETPEPHALTWNDKGKNEQCIAQLMKQ